MTKLNSLKISVSGVRGIVGQSLTPQLLTAFSAAFGSYAGRGPILVGTDTRPSRDMVMKAVSAGLLGTGAEVVDLGICPVPSVQIKVREMHAFGGIAITASHNPIEWNALKFIGPKGLFLNQFRAEELLDIYHQGNYRHVPDSEIRTVSQDATAFDTHLEKILAYIDRDKIARRKFRVAVDCVNGAGAVTTPRLLEALGCEYVAINTATDKPFPHSPEPVAENLGELIRLAAEKQVDIAFAQDADADRLAVICPKLGAIGEEYTVSLAAHHLLKREKRPVVVNLSTTMLIDAIAAEAGVPVYRTKIGEINVTEKLLAVNGAVGGEGNGGVIIPDIHPCRDSFGGMAVLLELLADEDKPLAGIIDAMPRYHIVKKKIHCPSDRVFQVLKRMEAVFGEEADVDRSDGIRLTWPDRWLQVRASNTEPIVRVFAEAEAQEAADELIHKAFKEVETIAG